MQFDSTTYRITSIGSASRWALIGGIAGLALSLIGFFVDRGQFFHSYLIAFCFWFSISLGALFFVLLHHLVGAVWSVILRRIMETAMTLLPWFVILFIPIALGMHDLYHWNHHDAVEQDLLLQKKAPYLNTTFFLLRSAGYFLIWFLLSRSLYSTSLAQDKHPGPEQTKRFRVISAPGMLLFAVTTTFASFDWLMSLDAHWYSTIYGVYFFSGSALAALLFTTRVAHQLRKNDILKKEITAEHYHDLGKLIFAFMILWAYMAFSQYFLIWYGNIPEEILWFHHRWDHGWNISTLVLAFGHFAVPFILLISRSAKRNPAYLSGICGFLLIMHWVDLHWLVMPNYTTHFSISWMDSSTMLGIGGIILWLFLKKLAAEPIIPLNDPKLKQSITSLSH